ncbi:GNAT family N-acetyltransferase [Undibacterium sp.]|uniref:GNAT family N-acetyltransferase n=1 Tax=Undibacterium sp. TaxID=1914977 RepID=UPI00374DE23D
MNRDAANIRYHVDPLAYLRLIESMHITLAALPDAQAILDLQKVAFAKFPNYPDPQLQPVQEIEEQIRLGLVLKGVEDGVIVGSVRAYVSGEPGCLSCHIGRLIVHPAHARKGYGRQLMDELERRYAHVHSFQLFTGVADNQTTIDMYFRFGYSEVRRGYRGTEEEIFMQKMNTAYGQENPPG